MKEKDIMKLMSKDMAKPDPKFKKALRTKIAEPKEDQTNAFVLFLRKSNFAPIASTFVVLVLFGGVYAGTGGFDPAPGYEAEQTAAQEAEEKEEEEKQNDACEEDQETCEHLQPAEEEQPTNPCIDEDGNVRCGADEQSQDSTQSTPPKPKTQSQAQPQETQSNTEAEQTEEVWPAFTNGFSAIEGNNISVTFNANFDLNGYGICQFGVGTIPYGGYVVEEDPIGNSCILYFPITGPGSDVSVSLQYYGRGAADPLVAGPVAVTIPETVADSEPIYLSYGSVEYDETNESIYAYVVADNSQAFDGTCYFSLTLVGSGGGDAAGTVYAGPPGWCDVNSDASYYASGSEVSVVATYESAEGVRAIMDLGSVFIP